MTFLDFRHQKLLCMIEKLPAVFSCVHSSKSDAKHSNNLTALMILPPQKKRKYDSTDIINHIKLLPKGSTEQAFAITAVATSGDASIGM